MQSSTLHYYFRGALTYAVATMVLGILWHVILFEKEYASLNVWPRISANDPDIQWHLVATLTQSGLAAYAFPRLKKGTSTIRNGIEFGFFLGLFQASVQVFTTLSKNTCERVITFVALETSFCLLSCIISALLLAKSFDGAKIKWRKPAYFSN